MAEESPESLPRTCSHREFIRLFLESERELLRYVMVLVPNVADARDIVQEAAVALWEKIDRYDPEKPFAPWACRFALNEARMFLRKQARQHRLAEEVVALVEEQRLQMTAELDQRRDHLKDCLQTLPERQGAMVRAHYFDELTTEELSGRFGKSVEAVYKALQRTRQALQQCIEQKMATEVGR